jgi:protein BCP1
VTLKVKAVWSFELLAQQHSITSHKTRLFLKVLFCVQQSEVDADDSDDDDDDDSSDVFGVTSVLNMTEKQNLECVQQLRTLLLDLCCEHGTDQTVALIRSLLSDDSQSIGLLINERIINIPAQISVPLLESLRYFLHCNLIFI